MVDVVHMLYMRVWYSKALNEFEIYIFFGGNFNKFCFLSFLLQKLDDDNQLKTPMCPHLTPCGWAVYTPFARTVEYFMKNT